MNPATLWATTFVDALAAAGLTAVCISPGSRSTPLTLAFDAHPDVEVTMHLDERSAAFFALGMAVAADKPVALVCTSGTAVANYMPAVVEANMSQVPLLLLTADRPPELRHSGANQTIDQVKFFGDQALWSVDVALPQADPPAVALRNLRTLTARAYAAANALRKGPVHLNFPFRKPLEPENDVQFTHNDTHTTIFQHGRLIPTSNQLQQLTEIIANNPRGLIVCGPRCPGGEFVAAAAALAIRSGYPLFADPISGLRFGAHVEETPIISGYESFLQHDPGWPQPQVILRFGAVPTSKWLNAYLERVRPQYRIHVRECGVWADDSHQTSHFLQANETAVCRALLDSGNWQKVIKNKGHEKSPNSPRNPQISDSSYFQEFSEVYSIPQREESGWLTAVSQTEAAHWQTLNSKLTATDFEGAYVADVVRLLPAGAALFMGNSLPIRHLDQFGQAQPKPIYAYANRGASGIDGNVSTALGLHFGRGGRLAAVLGDITFYHDLNGLLAIKQLKLENMTIVLLNNDGGGIFQRLPIAQHDPPFTRLFATPHGLDFAPVCEMYGLALKRPSSRSEFQLAFKNSLEDSQPTVIEIKTDRRLDAARRNELL